MSQFWWVDGAGARQGPVEQDEIARLIASGAIGRQSLVWTEGMAQWAVAGEVAPLAGFFGASAPTAGPSGWPSPLPGGGATAPAGWARSASPVGALTSQVTTFGLFGRSLLLLIGGIFVIPSPWTATYFWRYIGEATALPGGARFRFDGQPLDIWWVFVLQGLLGLFGYTKYGAVWSILVSMCLSWLVLRWFCSKLWTPENHTLSFDGELLHYIGWILLYGLSFVTIVGWAWVMAYMLDWICRNVRGGPAFAFVGSGLDILWRIAVGVIACGFVIPIPWILAWWTRWFTSQIVVSDAQAA